MDERRQYVPSPSGERPGTPGWLWALLGGLVVAVIALALVLVWLLLGSGGKPDEAATSEALDAQIATQIAQGWASATQAAQTAAALPTEAGVPATATPAPADTSQPTAPPPTTAVPAANTATNTPPATSTSKSTTTPTPTATRTPTYTPTSTPPPGCAIAVDAGLAPAWDRAKLGCPAASSTVLWSAWEPFEHGTMWWRSDSDWIYALYWQNGTNPVTGAWATGGDSWRWDQISFPEGRGLTPPPGLYEPIRGFGFVWFEKLGGPASQLGWATDPEKGFCAAVQPFDHGLIFQSSTIQQCQDGQGNWQTAVSIAPLLFALSDDGKWQRY